LAFGSAIWHGSHTYVGKSFDNRYIAFIAYLAHQASLSNLKTNSTVLKELSLTPRNKTAFELSDDFVSMFIDHPPPEWAEVLDTADFPHDTLDGIM